MLCNPFLLQMRHLRSFMFFRDKAGPGRDSLCTDVLLCSTLAHVHYISLLYVGVRACVDLCLFFALARVFAHKLGNLLGRVRV